MAYGCNFSKVVSILTKHMKLLPLQGAKLTALIPRVLPWARSFCPFRACSVYDKLSARRPAGFAIRRQKMS